jgi:hypothetical protein
MKFLSRGAEKVKWHTPGPGNIWLAVAVTATSAGVGWASNGFRLFTTQTNTG